MALQFSSTNHLDTASTIDFTAIKAITITWWGWFDTSGTGAQRFIQMGGGAVTGNFYFTPNSATSGKAEFSWFNTGNGQGVLKFDKASAAAWHFYSVQFNFDGAAGSPCREFKIDNAAVSNAATTGDTNYSAHFGRNQTIYFMSADGTQLYLPGRIDDIGIWVGITGTSGANLLSGSDITAVYGGHPTDASVQPSYYWPIYGGVSPEPASVGGVNLTVTGATYVDAHGGAESPPSSGGVLRRSSTMSGGFQDLSSGI